MKKLVAIVAVTVGFGFFSVPAFAADPVADPCGISGVVSSYSVLGWTDAGVEGDGYGAGISGKVNTCEIFGTSLNMQSDVYAEYSTATGGGALKAIMPRQLDRLIICIGVIPIVMPLACFSA